MGLSQAITFSPELFDGSKSLAFSAVTTAPAQTVTLQQITPGVNVRVTWGDGTSSIITAGNIGTTTHQYASAGTYTIRIGNAEVLSVIDLRDSKIVFNSAALLSCGDALTSLYLSGLGAGCTINSADMAHLKLSYRLYLFFTQVGTYAIDSTDFAAYTLSSTLYLYFPQAGTYAIDSADFAAYTLSSSLTLLFSQVGTYTIDSAHFAAYTLSYEVFLFFSQVGTYTINSTHFAAYTLSSRLYLHFPLAGTYTINSADFAAYTLPYQLYLYFPQAGTYTINSAHFAAYTLSSQYIMLLHAASTTATIAKEDFDGFPNLPTVQLQMGLTSAQVDAVLLGFYDGFATKAVSNGTIDLLGGGNAAPSGVSPGGAECPPTTGYNAAYELVNDSCGVSLKHWAAIETA